MSDGEISCPEDATRKLDFDSTKANKKGQSKGKGKGKSSKKKTDEKDDEFLSTVSECMSSLKDAIAPGSRIQDVQMDTHQQWANLLACKLRQMKPAVAEKFKLETDSRALDLVEFED